MNLYPYAEIVPAHLSNYRICTPKRATFELVVLHITSGRENPLNTAEMFQQPHHGASAHFVVGQRLEAEESVIQCVDLGDVAYHAHDANGRSVGVEHCAREPNEPGFPKGDPGLPMTDVQYKKSARLVTWLCRLAGLSVDRRVIVGHAEIDPKTTHRKCPTGQLDWARYMDFASDAAKEWALAT